MDHQQIQSAVDAALDTMVKNGFLKMVFGESMLSVASALTVDFPPIERIMVEQLDENLVALVAFVMDWKKRYRAAHGDPPEEYLYDPAEE